MSTQHDPAERAARYYMLLLRLYPSNHRQAFGAQMLQTFKDQYRDVAEHGGSVGVIFWLAVVGDAAKSIVKEQIVSERTKRVLLISILVMVATLLTGTAILLSRGVFLKFTVIIPMVMLALVSVVAKRSPQMGTPSSESEGHIWMQQGLRYGVLLGIFWIIFNLVNNLAAYDSPLYTTSRAIAGVLFTLGMPCLFCLAGFLSGRKSRTTREGAFAGLLAATISSTIAVVSLVAIMLLFWDTVRYNAFQVPGMIEDWQRSGNSTFDQFLWGDNLGGAFFMTLFSLVFGGLLGVLGGALGTSPPRSRSGTGREMAGAGGEAG